MMSNTLNTCKTHIASKRHQCLRTIDTVIQMRWLPLISTHLVLHTSALCVKHSASADNPSRVSVLQIGRRAWGVLWCCFVWFCIWNLSVWNTVVNQASKVSPSCRLSPGEWHCVDAVCLSLDGEKEKKEAVVDVCQSPEGMRRVELSSATNTQIKDLSSFTVLSNPVTFSLLWSTKGDV